MTFLCLLIVMVPPHVNCDCNTFFTLKLDTIERFDGKTWTRLGSKLSRGTSRHCAVGIR